jgi:hypothetical protein
MTGFIEEELSRPATPIFKDRKPKIKKEYKASTLRISPSVSSSSTDDTIKERKPGRIILREKRRQKIFRDI